MRQNLPTSQQDVVCKTVPAGQCEAEVLQSPRLAPELSCCLQDEWLRGRRARSVQRNALGPELRCCLQDRRAGASGRGVADAGGFGRQRRGFSFGTASSSRDCGIAIFGDCPGTLPDIRDRRRSWRGDHRRDADVGNRLRCKQSGGAGTWKAGRSAGSRGNAVHSYEWRFRIRQAWAVTSQNLETAVECLPRPRQWSSANTGGIAGVSHWR